MYFLIYRNDIRTLDSNNIYSSSSTNVSGNLDFLNNCKILKQLKGS